MQTFSIQNRRYLGNKYKLLPFIKEVVEKECCHISSFTDIFAGTGIVSSIFQEKQIMTNDILYSNYICNYAWFSSESFDIKKISNTINRYNTIKEIQQNYMTVHFADTYFSKEDCSKIGIIREDIEQNFINGYFNFREKSLLVAALIYAMDKSAKTCGHYDAYRKNVPFDTPLFLKVPNVIKNNHKYNQCFNEDANELVKKISTDLIYIDPPYNSRQYSDTYHLLENVARWEKPAVFGIAKKMDRTNIKSKYCTKDAENTFIELIKNIQAKYILISYNNMARKGNNRSNAKISDEIIIHTLQKKGDVKIFSEKHKAFTAGKSNIDDNEERLFLCTCK
ncbi:MAG: DNA adenine methylase [Neisseriaceae bacterium]|nr:DNA adenine methylase [Neisseriaceae bacterium]